ncbi:GET complex subunit get1 [Paraconiothyrium brasiliense]|uniref:GET complex subunit get1 n=1 Tax=Paraconiothyrium brasiliense TaxID=300254 RepID=A0ABR3S7Z8_9PLEO
MPSLLLVMFVLQTVLHIINTVGANTINELVRDAPPPPPQYEAGLLLMSIQLWILYNKLPTPTSSSAQRAEVLKREIVRLKRELATTSPQDNFSTWAKLDRQHNKATTEYQKLVLPDASLRTHQSTFTSTVSTFRWLGTQGTRFLLQMYFAKSPMFWIPAGWVPYYVEWILSFPRAPLGSVSINVWGIACASTLVLASEAVAAIYVLITKKPVPVATKEEPMAFEAKPGAQESTAKESTGKKEL